MSDLYERLLAKVTEAKATPPPCSCGTCPGDMAVVLAADALLVSLELHKPLQCSRRCGRRHEHVTCGVCTVADPMGPELWWPCSTVRAIARALDVPIGNGDQL